MSIKKQCSQCGGSDFRSVIDAWMKRTFSFVEKGQLEMCEGCAAKFLVCPKCGNHITRVHPALEKWEVDDTCSKCGYQDPNIIAWDGVSANPNKL